MRKITSFSDKKRISYQNKIKKPPPQYPDVFFIKKEYKIEFLHKNAYLCAP